MGQQCFSVCRERDKVLCQLLTDLEHLSIKGEFNEGHELYIYLSNIDFEATYSYVSRKDYQISLFRVYSINSMDSQSPQICQIQKNWIQSLKRHSTLISGSGEAQRIAFIENKYSACLLKYQRFLSRLYEMPLVYTSHTSIMNPLRPLGARPTIEFIT